MKILKEKSRAYKGRDYFKYKINIPEMILRRSGLNAGDELDVSTEKGAIILKKTENRGKIEEKS